MALYNSMLGTEQPQQNQYLTGDPSTQNNANTLWMDQSQTSPTTGINGGGGMGNISQNQSTPPSQVQNGTMLGTIAAGGYQNRTPTPAGFDQGKWDDPNKHDPKYDVGRLVSSGASNEQVQQMLSQQYPGWTVIGGDKIRDPQGNIFDFRYASHDPQYGGKGLPAWLDQGNVQGGMQQGSMFGMQQQNNPFAQNNMMQQIWQAIQARRQQFAGQQFNPTGGPTSFNPTGQQGQVFGSGASMGNTGVSGMIGQNPQPVMQPQDQRTMTQQSNGLVYWPGMQMQPGVNY